VKTVAIETTPGPIAASYGPRFQGVDNAFVANFVDRDEVGASVCLNLDGHNVVDLWGGRVARGGAPWQSDSLCTVFSATKGTLALCAYMLADRGELDLDARIVDY
jgi:CubicO group peptidase (beta-lactamase class C family)